MIAMMLLIILVPYYKSVTHCGEKCKACLEADNIPISQNMSGITINESDFRFYQFAINVFHDDHERKSPFEIHHRIDHPPES